MMVRNDGLSLKTKRRTARGFGDGAALPSARLVPGGKGGGEA